MKKTLTINLANQVFHIDEDAYNALKEYLERIEAHFSNQEERHDIINDIELRIAELFAGKLTANKQVITYTDLKEIIHIMGDPDEIGGNENGYEQNGGSRIIKRLFRDPDNRVLGGVCGGIGQYFIIDPLVIRIIFLVFFFGFGIGLLIYIILWIAVPEAVTTAQKLQMRGDPVTASNISKFMKDEFESVKRSFRYGKN
jgi:phage shock protein PspC (stress-responsive transcriptional regulator)